MGDREEFGHEEYPSKPHAEALIMGLTSDQFNAHNKAYEEARKKQEEQYKADLAEQTHRELVRFWQNERRSLWSAIIVQGTAGVSMQSVLHGIISPDAPVNPQNPNKMDLKPIKRAADQALEWFDEKFGHEFPLDFFTPKGKP